MSHATHATALALKAAGLPQPQPAPGQMWYLPKLGAFPGGEVPLNCVIYISEDKTFSPPANRVYFASVGAYVFRNTDVGQSLSVDNFLANAIFAPDADYIIKHFAEKEMGDMAVSYSAAGAEFISFDPAMEENWRGIGSGENMAEAAAALFLERVKTPV